MKKRINKSKFTVRFWREGQTVYMRCLRIGRGVRGEFEYETSLVRRPFRVSSIGYPELVTESVYLSGGERERDTKVAQMLFNSNERADAWMFRAIKLCREAGGEVLEGKQKKGREGAARKLAERLTKDAE